MVRDRRNNVKNGAYTETDILAETAAIDSALSLVPAFGAPPFSDKLETLRGKTFLSLLKQHFPWLGTCDEVNGGDTVEALGELYESLGGEMEPEEN